MKRRYSRSGVVALLTGIFFLFPLLLWCVGLAPQWGRDVQAAREDPPGLAVRADEPAVSPASVSAASARAARGAPAPAPAAAQVPSPVPLPAPASVVPKIADAADAASAAVQPDKPASPQPADTAAPALPAGQASSQASAAQTPTAQTPPPASPSPVRSSLPAAALEALARQQSAPSVVREASRASAPSAPPRKTVRLFGTVEFKRPLSSLPGWLELLRRNAKNSIFTSDRALKRGVTWGQFRAGAAGKQGMALLRYVNRVWHPWPYREDRDVWGKEDYWAIPAEFLRRSGDCEDYAIVKYFTLKELGVAPETMRIVVVRDTVRNLGHAVLAVYMDDTAYILDNLSNAVLPHNRLRQYRPQYSVNEQGRWAHLRVTRTP